MSVVIVNGVGAKATWREVIDPSQIAKLRPRASHSAQGSTELRIGTKQENRLSHRVPGPDSGGGPGQISSASVALRPPTVDGGQWPPGRSGVP